MRGVSVVAAIAIVLAGCSVPVPQYPVPASSTWLEQGWQPGDRAWYHAADQGTLTFGIPREFFMALEQPEPSLDGRAMLADQGYLDRFGFIPSPAGLPVGFAPSGSVGAPNDTHPRAAVLPDTMAPWLKPGTTASFTSLGLSCAACHTGRLTHQGRELLIDGGAAMLSLGQFSKALGLSMVATEYNPLRWQRFSARVLGANARAEDDAALRLQFKAALGRLAWQRDQDVATAKTTTPVEEGFGRLDALNRIGNAVFAVNTRQAGNYAAITAPVNFPHIWSAPRFDWVQYNGSIEQPMVRNAGEALGVAAPSVFRKVEGGLPVYSTAVQPRVIHAMEQMLAGPQPKGSFGGLRSPAWPEEVLGKIDQPLAAKGEALYAANCQGCHLPSPRSAAFWDPKLWAPIGGGQRVLKLKLISIAEIGTDPAQAADMKAREISSLPELGIKNTNFGPALGELVGNTMKAWNAAQTPPAGAAERAAVDGYRPNGIRAELAYKARPLNGIWATGPFLHNGSVPTLYALLSPLRERPVRFHVGTRAFDPVDVGYQTTPVAGDFLLDTRVRGNFNTRHVFDDLPRGNGVIGRRLSEDERRALVEFLKTL